LCSWLVGVGRTRPLVVDGWIKGRTAIVLNHRFRKPKHARSSSNRCFCWLLGGKRRRAPDGLFVSCLMLMHSNKSLVCAGLSTLFSASESSCARSLALVMLPLKLPTVHACPVYPSNCLIHGVALVCLVMLKWQLLLFYQNSAGNSTSTNKAETFFPGYLYFSNKWPITDFFFC
jgi:hypothetical protein